MLNLEKVECDQSDKFTVYRAKVPGGWLVFMYSTHSIVLEEAGYGYAYGGSTFLPDPYHNWDGSSL